MMPGVVPLRSTAAPSSADCRLALHASPHQTRCRHVGSAEQVFNSMQLFKQVCRLLPRHLMDSRNVTRMLNACSKKQLLTSLTPPVRAVEADAGAALANTYQCVTLRPVGSTCDGIVSATS